MVTSVTNTQQSGGYGRHGDRKRHQGWFVSLLAIISGTITLGLGVALLVVWIAP